MDLFRGRRKLPSKSEAQRVDLEPECPSELLSPQTWRVGLLELPNETILSILEELQDEDVYAISFLSRRLHHLALPLYLSRKSFGFALNDQLSLFNYNARDGIKALSRAFFWPSLRKLHYAIDCRKSHEELLDEIRVMKRVVDKLSAVNEVAVSFEYVPAPSEGALPAIVPSNVFPSSETERGGTYGLTAGSCAELTSALESVISSRCRFLNVGHGFLYSPSSLEIKAAMARHFGGLQGLKRKLAKVIGRLRLSSSNGVGRNSLESFNLHSRMLFHPYFCRWTIDTLNNSVITKLSINHHYMMHESTWALILPCITISTLTDFSLNCCSIWTRDLLRFLRRHSRMQRLYIGRHVTGPDNRFSFPTSVLRQLTHLCGPPDWLAFLLSSRGSLPALSCITIILRILGTQHFNFSILDEPLNSVILRLASMHEVHLALSLGSPLTDWIPLENEAESSKATTVHALITHLEIYIRMYCIPHLVVAKIPKWVAQFPDLRHLTLLTLSETGSFSPPKKQRLVHSIIECCPKVTVDFRLVEDAV